MSLNVLTKSKPNKSPQQRSLLVVGLLCLSGCEATSSKLAVEKIPLSCPAYPIAGPAVAAELEQLDPALFPAFEEWLGRLDKFSSQLEEQQ